MGKKTQTLLKKLLTMFLIGFQATMMLKKKISMKRKLNSKKLSTQSFKNSTNNTVEWEENKEVMMTGMMMILQITMSFKQHLMTFSLCNKFTLCKAHEKFLLLFTALSLKMGIEIPCIGVSVR